MDNTIKNLSKNKDETEILPYNPTILDYASLDENENENENVCCENPFVSYNAKTLIYNCRKCLKNYKKSSVISYTCVPCENYDIITNITINLCKNGRTDWTTCKTCNRFVNYERKKSKINFIL